MRKLLLALLLALAPPVYAQVTVPETTTPNLGLTLPEHISNSWAADLMQNFRILDSLPVAATPTDDAIGVGSGVLWQNTILPNCPDTGGQHLNYDSATNLFSCGTSGGGGGGGASDFSDLTGTATDAQIPNNITIDLATAAT